jgi:DNA repair protein RecO (recombination protein O)
MNKSYSSEGWVLARYDYGEADRILVLFTKHFGQVRVVAKGVRRPESRKRGHIELLSYIKFSARRTKGMDIITEVETIDNNDIIRGDLKKIALGYYLCEILLKLTREGENQDLVFKEIAAFFDRIKTSNSLKSLRKDFVTRMLVVLGFWPQNKTLSDPDSFLKQIIEREINSVRVGRAMLL